MTPEAKILNTLLEYIEKEQVVDRVATGEMFRLERWRSRQFKGILLEASRAVKREEKWILNQVN